MRQQIGFTLLLLLAACSQPNQNSSGPAVAHQEYSIEQFYKNTRFGGGSFSPDETKLLVHSDASGISNLYELNLQDGSSKQITASNTESFVAIDYVPGTNHVLYAADKGGNELALIYLLRDDKSVVDLTPAEKEKAQFGGWSEDRKAMFYISNKRDPRFFDFYKMNTADWKPNLLYQNNEGYGVVGLSHNENFIGLSKSITNTNVKLFVLDRAQNKTTEISDEPGEYKGAGFSQDNRYFYYISNAGKEFAYLAEYELATGKKRILYETKWDVMYSSLSKNEKYRVIGVNEDGKNKLIVLDNKTQKAISFPEIPDGDIAAVKISESEKQIRLTIGTSKSPSSIYVYNLESKKLKKLTESLNPEINPSDLVSAEVVRFKSFDGLEIPAIYYKPKTASENNKVPALVWVHGGPGGQTRVGYFALLQYLVNHGYAVLAVNNRGSSGYGKTFYELDDQNHGDKDLKDCIAGKQWLQAQNYIAKDKIGIMGGSYGGYITMAAMTFAPDEFKAGVNLFGVTNWLRTLKSIPPYWEAQKKALYAELGDPYSADSTRLYNISPLFHAQKVKNPVMVLQGANDPRVLKIESDEIVEAVKKNQVPVEYVVFPDEGHGFVKKDNEINAYGKVLKFLDRYLKQDKVI